MFWKEEQHEKNAPNVWFSGTKNTRRKFNFLFYIHYGCDRGGIFVEHRCSRTRPRHHHTPISLVIVVTYEDVLQEDFGSSIPSIENSYLQTGNSKQQPTNRNATMTLRLTGEWGTTEA
jgi:hypothetical protein